MGVGAYAYYRRIVEAQRGRLFDRMIKVTRLKPGADDLVKELEAAKQETQFEKSIRGIKHALPDSLLINGHNPLLLLHNALSEGLHAESDEDCLSLAHDIRVVLTAVAERMAEALREDAELQASVGRLMQPKGGEQRSVH
ncbi:hypothetical protein ACERK3_01410 [Phycisphaerales bacterium AB-hyl4]|uniref:Uncharacterized protein n=1 Tax=Natronomicrosphaera hydrolytica TaxID=3242702 RepID=A0ABV4U019_9BACT